MSVHDDSPQSPFVAAAAALDEDAREHAADAAESVQHDVLGRFLVQPLIGDLVQAITHVISHVTARRQFLVTGSQSADVDSRRG